MSHRSYDRGPQQHVAKAWGKPPDYVSLPINAVDAVLAGLDHKAIATALPILAIAQIHTITRGLHGLPITVIASTRWLADATRLDTGTVLDALDDLVCELPDGWPPIFDRTAVRRGEIRITVAPPWSCPRHHLRIDLPLPTERRGAAIIAIRVAENVKLSWPGKPAKRIDYRASERSVEAYNQHLRCANRNRKMLAQKYGVHLPRAVRQRVRLRLAGPATVMGLELEF